MSEQNARQWLLLIYKVPPEPTRFRTYVWRQAKTLGCFHLQQAVWLLPKTPDHEEEFKKLSAKIEEFGGEANLLTTTSPDAEWEDRIISGFNAIRNEEYAEIAENEERFQDEIRRETRKRKFTFTELEDLEADWEKIKRGMEKVRARDFFGASGRRDTEAQLAESAKALEEFASKVYEHEGVEGPSGTETGGK